MKKKMFIKDQNGAAVVEFAIVLPLLVLLFCGMIEFGLLFYNKQVITNASREGARAGIIAYDRDDPPGTHFSTDAQIIDIVEKYCEGHLITINNPHDNVDISFSSNGIPDPDRTDHCFTFETPFTVTVEYDYHFLFSSVLGLGATMKIPGKTTMLKQQSL